jgi:NAD(P)-dependent dehydrogenase (short-subunit alcohol dehydrogenase family)
VGRAIAEDLARHGAAVAICYRRDGDAAAETVAAIDAAGGTARAYQADISELTDLEGVVGATRGELGPIDLLVNNAGVASRGNDVADTDPGEVARLLAVHAIGAHHLCRLVVPEMRTRPRGDIVMISSIAVDKMSGGGAPYNMAKAAMEALAHTLAKEEIANGIHVNIVAPGVVATEMGNRLIRATLGIPLAELDERTPLGRVCRPEDVANTVTFLCSEQASYLSGQRLAVDGGWRDATAL